MRSAADLHAYQHAGADFLYEHPFSALWADLGLGKSVITLTLLSRLRREGWKGKALIIGPLRVVNQGWPAELAAWKHLRHLTARLLTGPAKQRLDVLFGKGCTKFDVHLINREQVSWLVSEFIEIKPGHRIKILRPWPYDVVVIDESTSMKDYSTNRFKALKAVLPWVTRLHELTATPAAEGYMGLFAQTYLMDRGERFGKGITHFRETYFDHNPYAKSWTLKPGADKLIEAKLADICLVMKARDYLPAREPLVVDRKVHLTAEQMAMYRVMEREFVLDLPDGLAIEAETAANLASKLLQLASGAVYDENHVAHLIHNHKIDELHQLVEEAQGAPIIVAYWFKSSLARLQAAFPKAKTIDAKGTILEAWNKGKVPMLLLHPASASEGLNMQYGGSTLAFFDLPWSLEKYLQTRGRIDRQGQKDVVRVFHIVAAGTDDEWVVERLREKRSVQEGFLARVKMIRERMKRDGR